MTKTGEERIIAPVHYKQGNELSGLKGLEILRLLSDAAHVAGKIFIGFVSESSKVQDGE